MDNLIERILEAIKTKKESEILRFGEFTIIGKLGRGQQGMVVLAENQNKKRFAIKLYSPTDEDPRIIKASKERFIREAKILLKLSHRNIVNVYVAGSARWDNSENKWRVSTSFTELSEVLYYVMNYVKGRSVKSLFYKGFFKETMQYKIDPSKGTQLNLNLFERLIIQISSAMAFFHMKGVVHRDIKPDNIIYSMHDDNFIIVDFGFAKYFKKGSPQSGKDIIRRKPYIDMTSEKQGTVDKLSDQYIFAEMLLQILEIFKPKYADRYVGIESSLEKAHKEKRNQRYENMSEFKSAVEPHLYLCPYRTYNFQMGAFLIPLTRFGHFNSKLRIPFSGSIPLFKEILDIIDTDDFQRLRGVRQLGPTQFVYPGANHTRFEHSLGTYFLSLRYLQVLLKNPIFYKAVEPVDEAIKLVVLGSLLHDIGHYPYSHWIEEITGLPDELSFRRHEDRAKDIITRGEIGKIIEAKWEVDLAKLCRLISGSGGLSGREELMRSMIDSDIDVDRIDYLQRDSAHCGVPYGSAFDVERLISSLWINEKGNKICLTEKGRSSFAALTMSNIIMYQEVYWHKTVRACTAMFKRFFYEFLKRKRADVKRVKQKYLCYPDGKFTETLYLRTRKDEELNRLIRPFANKSRVLYKPAYVHYHDHELYLTHESTKNFFTMLKKSDYPTLVRMTTNLVENLKPHISGIKELDLILETTPVDYREAPQLIGFRFYDSKLGEYEGLTSEIESLNRYLAKNRRSYVFCKPKYYDSLKKLSKNGKLNEIFGKVIEIVRNKKQT